MDRTNGWTVAITLAAALVVAPGARAGGPGESCPEAAGSEFDGFGAAGDSSLADAVDEILDEDVLEPGAAMKAGDGQRAGWAAWLARECDRDGDGVLDDGERAEAQALLAGKRAHCRQERSRKECDLDGDGRLNPEEMVLLDGKLADHERRRGEQVERLKQKFDRDGDGRLDATERQSLRLACKKTGRSDSGKEKGRDGKGDQGADCPDPSGKAAGKSGKGGSAEGCKDGKKGCPPGGKGGKHGGKKGGGGKR